MKRERLIGIYQIRNLVDGKLYVGSAIDILNRWSWHECKLEDGGHCNQKLLRAWRKHGAAAFIFEILECCERAQLLQREQFWLDKLDVVKVGYNIESIARSAAGRKWRASSKRKSSVSAKRVAADPAERKRRSDRAKRQHAAGTLGRATWKPGTAEAVAGKVGKSSSAFWAIPENKVWMSLALRRKPYVKPSDLRVKNGEGRPRAKYQPHTY